MRHIVSFAIALLVQRVFAMGVQGSADLQQMSISPESFASPNLIELLELLVNM